MLALDGISPLYFWVLVRKHFSEMIYFQMLWEGMFVGREKRIEEEGETMYN